MSDLKDKIFAASVAVGTTLTIALGWILAFGITIGLIYVLLWILGQWEPLLVTSVVAFLAFFTWAVAVEVWNFMVPIYKRTLRERKEND